jgi:hypothetical protein
MLTSTNSLFYIAFLSQIFLLSYYFPKKILSRTQYVMDTYPPSQYPRLYPKPIEYYRLGQLGFKYVTRFIAVLGFVILYAIMFLVDHSTFADDGFISEAWPAGYGVIQFLPLMVLEFSEFGQYKMMRKANVATTRTADLRRRGLFDVVSPVLVVLAVSLIAVTILVDLYVHQFIIEWGHDTVERAITLTVTNLLLAGLGAWLLYGKKLNPHQSPDDRNKQISTNLQSFLYVSIAMSVFFMTQAADDVYNLDFLDATLMTIYFQAIAYLSLGHGLRKQKLENIDFEGYKDSAGGEYC